MFSQFWYPIQEIDADDLGIHSSGDSRSLKGLNHLTPREPRALQIAPSGSRQNNPTRSFAERNLVLAEVFKEAELSGFKERKLEAGIPGNMPVDDVDLPGALEDEGPDLPRARGRVPDLRVRNHLEALPLVN